MRDYGSRWCKARITLAACVTAVTAAALAASAAASSAAATGTAAATGSAAVSGTKTGAASPARPSSASGASTAQVTVRPDAIRVPGAPTLVPASTADCEQLDGIACFDPDQLRAAYRLPPLYAKGITGTGATIMIVDSFGSPTIRTDLAAFDRQFGYPAPPHFTIIAPVGTIPPFNPADTDAVTAISSGAAFNSFAVKLRTDSFLVTHTSQLAPTSSRSSM